MTGFFRVQKPSTESSRSHMDCWRVRLMPSFPTGVRSRPSLVLIPMMEPEDTYAFRVFLTVAPMQAHKSKTRLAFV